MVQAWRVLSSRLRTLSFLQGCTPMLLQTQSGKGRQCCFIAHFHMAGPHPRLSDLDFSMSTKFMTLFLRPQRPTLEVLGFGSSPFPILRPVQPSFGIK